MNTIDPHIEAAVLRVHEEDFNGDLEDALTGALKKARIDTPHVENVDFLIKASLTPIVKAAKHRTESDRIIGGKLLAVIDTAVAYFQGLLKCSSTALPAIREQLIEAVLQELVRIKTLPSSAVTIQELRERYRAAGMNRLTGVFRDDDAVDREDNY